MIEISHKLNPKSVALSLTSVSAVVYIICAVFFTIAPKYTMNLFKDMFRGIDITLIAKTNISLINILAGFFQIVISSFLVGWLFALLYNYFSENSKKKRK